MIVCALNRLWGKFLPIGSHFRVSTNFSTDGPKWFTNCLYDHHCVGPHNSIIIILVYSYTLGYAHFLRFQYFARTLIDFNSKISENCCARNIALRFERARQTKTDKPLYRPIQQNTKCAWKILFVKPETFFNVGFVFLVNRHRKTYCVWSRVSNSTYSRESMNLHEKSPLPLHLNRLFGIDFILYRSQSLNSAITFSIIQLWYVCKSDSVIVGVSIGLIKF